MIKWPLTNGSLEEVVELLISELSYPEDFRNLVQVRDSGQIVMALNGSASFVYKDVDSTIIGRMEFRLPPEFLKLLQLTPIRPMALQGNAQELARTMKAGVLGIQEIGRVMMLEETMMP